MYFAHKSNKNKNKNIKKKACNVKANGTKPNRQ